jgi:hypothetical protein
MTDRFQGVKITFTAVQLVDAFLVNFLSGNTKPSERKWLIENIRNALDAARADGYASGIAHERKE